VLGGGWSYNKSMARRLMYGVLVVLLVGCVPGRRAESAAGMKVVDAELGAVPPTAARVCVMRPASEAATVTMELRDNERLVGATRGNTYTCWLAAPGEHQIRSPDDTGPTYLHALAGHHYWLHQDVVMLAGDLHAHLDWVDDAAAAELLDACTQRVMVSVPGHDERTDAVAVSPAL
jgi:hypothetical protein